MPRPGRNFIDMQRLNCEASANQPASVPTAILHARFELEAIPLLGLLQRGAMRLTNNRQDAEDLLQDTMLLAYAGFGSFREGTNLTAWMFRIMQNAWISRYRKMQRRPPEVLIDYWTESTMVDEAPHVRRSQRSAEAAALEQIPDERVLNALMALSEKFRMAVYYADVEGFRYKDIAYLTATPVGTVMSRVHRGRQLLRKSLEELGDDCGIIAATGTRQ
ncbi:sigma-70 family RNA polymerase sigma factor [Mycobacterium hodleri]|uniref:Sigma-70 family RNA polymerase sigma factor n=2 Tax=Mycolicibacterium hodleri TaxID=49897 RepID=A0A544W712_9MYCO|nr:sigma-70 family RNA polymerase sigma factor [Mycolicibacterium hodleri]